MSATTDATARNEEVREKLYALPVTVFRPWVVGCFLFWAGVAAVVAGLAKKITVYSGSGEWVVNLQLVHEQQAMLLVGCTLMICGSIGMAAGYVARNTNALSHIPRS